VGQPRDGNPEAAFGLFDPVQRAVEFRRVGYDVEGAQERIRRAGLPDVLAERLTYGL
jgi:diadenosine tetraphosphatase ApaH/serine/threonine PP2A family protein phosphatase